jgi:hypothetical protein
MNIVNMKQHVVSKLMDIAMKRFIIKSTVTLNTFNKLAQVF